MVTETTEEKGLQSLIQSMEVEDKLHKMLNVALQDANLLLSLDADLPVGSIGIDYLDLINVVIDGVSGKATEHDLTMKYLGILEKMCDLQMSELREKFGQM